MSNFSLNDSTENPNLYERGYTSDSELYQHVENTILRKENDSNELCRSDLTINVIFFLK